MWPFKATSGGTAPETPTDTSNARLTQVESDLRMLRGEWEDTYERVMRALRRLNKRHQDLDRRESADEETHQEPPGATISGIPGMDPISAAIHARRARAVPPGGNGQGR